MKSKLLIAAILVTILAAPTPANWAPGDAPFINTWLVLGTYDNQEGAGMRTDLIGEATILGKILQPVKINLVACAHADKTHVAFCCRQ